MQRNISLVNWLMILIVLAFWLPPPAEAQKVKKQVRGADLRFDSNKPALDIPLQLTKRNHIFVPVHVNNSEPLWFILDSGSGSTLLNKRLVKNLNLKVEAVGEVEGAGEGTEEAVLTNGVKLRLGNITLFNQEVPAMDFKALEASLGRNIDGMLGYDFIRRFVVEVDYAARVINIYDASKYRYKGRGESLPITIKDDQPLIWLKVTLPGRKPLKGRFVVDSGAGGGTLEFNGHFIRKHKLLDGIKILDTVSLEAIGGKVNISYGYVQNIRIGHLVLENPIIGFSQTTKGGLANPNRAGLIGANLLRRFTVIYDDARHRIIFEPNSNFAQPDVTTKTLL
jgi:hypothetical protein